MDDRRLKVLLIEDSLIYILLLQQILLQDQIDSESANSLQDGAKLAAEKVFDAVLLDLGLPDSQGLHTFTQFQALYPALPVIILTGLEDESLAAMAVQLGAQDYLTKGSHLTQSASGSKLLIRSIHYAIERHHIQVVLTQERSLLELRVNERTSELKQANQRLRNLTARLVSAQEDERRRLSLELHDEAGQALTALSLSLSLLRSELSGDSSWLDNRLQEAIQLTGTTMEHLRALAHNLRPPSLDNVGLNQSLRDFCQRTSIRAQINVEYRSNGADSLPGYIQVSLYRVVQEALTNIVKHAKASHAWVQLEVDAEGIQLLIRDDGIGFLPVLQTDPGEEAGIGLAGMRERVEALGGTFEIISGSGKGTTVQVGIPSQEGL